MTFALFVSCVLLMFGVNGVVDILLHYTSKFSVTLSPNSGYIYLALAIASERLLVIYARDEFEYYALSLHYATLISVLQFAAVVVEMKYRNNASMALSRAYFTLLQGTWLLQVGWILYPPFQLGWILYPPFEWPLTVRGESVFLALIFIWHVASDFVMMLILRLIVGFIGKKTFSNRCDDRVLVMQPCYQSKV